MAVININKASAPGRAGKNTYALKETGRATSRLGIGKMGDARRNLETKISFTKKDVK